MAFLVSRGSPPPDGLSPVSVQSAAPQHLLLSRSTRSYLFAFARATMVVEYCKNTSSVFYHVLQTASSGTTARNKWLTSSIIFAIEDAVIMCLLDHIHPRDRYPVTAAAAAAAAVSN